MTDLLLLKNITMANNRIPVWMSNFNHTDEISNDWMMWHNGYDCDRLQLFLNKNYPEMLQSQTIKDICSPMFPCELSKNNFELIDLENNNKPYYYPIGIQWWGMIDNLIEETVVIPQTIIDQIKNLKSKVLLFNNREQWGSSFWISIIDRIKKIYPVLDQDDFVVSCNNPDLDNLNSIPVISNQCIEQYTGNWNSHNDMWNAIENNINQKQNRPYKFVCLMRRPNASRWAISAELMEYRLRGESLMSMILDTQMIEQNGPVFEKLDIEYYKYVRSRTMVDNEFTIGDYQNVGNTYPHTVDKLRRHQQEYPFWIPNDTNALTNPIQDPSIQKFTHSYLHIVSETRVEPNQGVCLSEKVFKPIWYMQPFVVFGTPNTLHELTNLGYKTFDTWIDQTYDSIPDITERFYTAIQSVKQFCNQSVDQINNQMVDMLPTLIHNKQVLAEYQVNTVDKAKQDLCNFIHNK